MEKKVMILPDDEGNPETRNITFTVNDGTNPIQGASVSIGNITGTTGSQGGCTLQNVTDGENTVIVTADGYLTKTQTIIVSESDTSFTISLDEIVYDFEIYNIEDNDALFSIGTMKVTDYEAYTVQEGARAGLVCVELTIQDYYVNSENTMPMSNYLVPITALSDSTTMYPVYTDMYDAEDDSETYAITLLPVILRDGVRIKTVEIRVRDNENNEAINGATVTVDGKYTGVSATVEVDGHDVDGVLFLELPIQDEYAINATASDYKEFNESLVGMDNPLYVYMERE